MRNVFFLSAFLCFSFSVPLYSQTGGPKNIAELDVQSSGAAAKIISSLKSAGGGSVASGIYNETALITYWVENIMRCLSPNEAGANSGITVLSNPAGAGPAGQADFVINATLMEAGQTVRIYTKLVKRADSSVLATFTNDLERGQFIASLLTHTTGDSSRSRYVPPDWYEPDSRENPLAWVVGGEEIRRTLHEGDEDWFSIEAPPEGGMINVETTGDLDTVMELYGPDGRKLETNDDGGRGGNARIRFTAQAGQTYLIKVSGYAGDETGDYGITFTRAGGGSGSIIRTGEALEAGVEKSGYINSDDELWFRFSVPEGGAYVTLRTAGYLDTVLEVYDSTGQMIAEDDDTGDEFNALISMDLEAGDYFVKLETYDEGTYRITLDTSEPNRPDEYENDDSRENAKPIAIGEEQVRTFTDEDDVDWAVLTVTERGMYTIRAQGRENDNLDTFITLYDQRGDIVARDDDSGGGFTARVNKRLDPGAYYIRVHVLEHPSGSYVLSVKKD